MRSTDQSTCDLKETKKERQECHEACEAADEAAQKAGDSCSDAAKKEAKLMRDGAQQTQNIAATVVARQESHELSNGDNTCTGQDVQRKRKRIGEVVPPDFEDCVKKAAACQEKGGQAGFTQMSCQAAGAAVKKENNTRQAEADELSRVCGRSNANAGKVHNLALPGGGSGDGDDIMRIMKSGRSDKDESTVTGKIHPIDISSSPGGHGESVHMPSTITKSAYDDAAGGSESAKISNPFGDAKAPEPLPILAHTSVGVPSSAGGSAITGSGTFSSGSISGASEPRGAAPKTAPVADVTAQFASLSPPSLPALTAVAPAAAVAAVPKPAGDTAEKPDSSFGSRLTTERWQTGLDRSMGDSEANAIYGYFFGKDKAQIERDAKRAVLTREVASADATLFTMVHRKLTECAGRLR